MILVSKIDNFTNQRMTYLCAMYDLILTLVVVYLGYRGYSWYTNIQEQIKSGQKPPNKVDANAPTGHRRDNDDDNDDYIDYEEVD